MYYIQCKSITHTVDIKYLYITKSRKNGKQNSLQTRSLYTKCIYHIYYKLYLCKLYKLVKIAN